MSMRRTIACDVEGCVAFLNSPRETEGFPGWGVVQGIQNKKTGEDEAYLCPEHMTKIKLLLDGGL